MNPTPSQPERPEPPEGYQPFSASDVVREIRDGDIVWHDGAWRIPTHRIPLTGLYYATRTPAPEAVAGERKNMDAPPVVVGIPSPAAADFVKAGEIVSKVLHATPPVEADKDICPSCKTKMHLVCDATGSRDYYHCFNCADKDAEIARLQAYRDNSVEVELRLRADLTTARATIATLEKERDEAQTDARHWHQKLVVTMNAINGREDEILELCESDSEYKVAAEVISVQDARNLHATIAERDKRIETLVGALEALDSEDLLACLEIRSDIPAGVCECAGCKSRKSLAHAAEGKEQP